MTDYSYTVNEPILEVRNVCVAYAQPVLRDLNFSINNIVRPGMTQGQVVALLAPSGMGKSQAFRCMAGLQKPNAGEVVLGEEATGVPSATGAIPVAAGMVGVVAQSYPLLKHRTVYQNLFRAARLKYPADQAKDIVLGLLERFGMADKVDLYPAQLSGGQQQRTAILQSMVCSGHLLLMDEPFSGLDINLKAEVQNMIMSLAASHELNTIVLTTHDIGAAIAVSDTILLLGRERDAEGKIIPGANIRKTFDLAARGLAWRPNIETLPDFHELELEIRADFRTL